MRVIFPDRERMIDLGYQKLAFVPFLISEDGSYPAEANRYLRERACLEWQPASDKGVALARFTVRQTVQSREAMARRLMEFLLFCTSEDLDWREVSYLDDVIDKWQVGMLTGVASRTKKKLGNDTVNVRVSEACYFLLWSAERGFRKPFEMLYKERGRAQAKKRRGRDLNAVSRAGELHTIKSPLSLPTTGALEKWRSMLGARHGEVMALLAEFLIRTGVRISEAIGFRAEDLPDKNFGVDHNSWREDWITAGEVPCLISMGNKGPKVELGSEKSTKPRYIYIPIDLADRLDHYKTEGRKTLITRWISASKTRSERSRRQAEAQTNKFWLGKRGRPLTAGWVRQAWSSIDLRPWKWSPHRARHEFAVNTIVEYTKNMMSFAKVGAVPSAGWLHGLMAGQIHIILSPLLGHIDEHTTGIYLTSARERLLAEFSHPAILWTEDCEKG